MYPSGKGLSLNLQEWEKFKNFVPEIDKKFADFREKYEKLEK